jgi:hypothetical protein
MVIATRDAPSAFGMRLQSEDRARALLAGFMAHVAKSVEPAELFATVAAVSGRTHPI